MSVGSDIAQLRSGSPMQLSPTPTVHANSSTVNVPPAVTPDDDQTTTPEGTAKCPLDPILADKKPSGDVEKQATHDQPISRHGHRADAKDDGEWIVRWNGSDDPKDPLNTPGWRKKCLHHSRTTV